MPRVDAVLRFSIIIIFVLWNFKFKRLLPVLFTDIKVQNSKILIIIVPYSFFQNIWNIYYLFLV